VLILADDMGYSDIGCFGGEVSTPNIDRLAQEGMRFTQFYNSARCCPTRASLLTGLHPHQAGIGHMTESAGFVEYQGWLRDDRPTIAEALRPAGYRTFLSGKWHVGGSYLGPHEDLVARAGRPQNPRPVDRGFEHHWGTLVGAGSYYQPFSLLEDDRFIDTIEPDFFYTDEIATHAIDYIATAGDAPYFLYLGYTAPHWPLHASPRDVEPYVDLYASQGWDALRQLRYDRLVGEGLIEPHWGLSPRDERTPPWLEADHRLWQAQCMATYAAQISAMDRSIGRVLEAIDADNTVVMFLSDNGGCAEFLSEEWTASLNLVPRTAPDGRPVRGGNLPHVVPGGADTYMSYGRSWANVSNAPFRRYKHWVHEGGISTPFIARWPGRIRPGSLTHEPCHVMDVMATCVEMAGAPGPDLVEGRSLLPLFSDAGFSAERDLCLEHEGNRAIRRGRFKLVSAHPGSWELYDIERDRTELEDLSDRYPGVVGELSAAWDDWARRVGVRDWTDVLSGLRAQAAGPG